MQTFPPTVRPNSKSSWSQQVESALSTVQRAAKASEAAADEKFDSPYQILTIDSETHPIPHSIPLVVERPAEYRPYTLKPAQVPPPFPPNGESLSHNEERFEILKTTSASLSLPGLVTYISSPRASKRVAIWVNTEGQVGYALEHDGSPLIVPSFYEMSVNHKPCRFYTKDSKVGQVHWRTERGSSYWRPIPMAERRWYYAEYNSIKVWCEGVHCRNCPFVTEFRVFDEGVGIRSYAQPTADDIKSVSESSDKSEDHQYIPVYSTLDTLFATDKGLFCWATSQEEPFIPQKCNLVPETMTPVTIAVSSPDSAMTPGATPPGTLYVSILQADGPAFMRSFGKASTAGSGIEVSARGEAHYQPREGMPGVMYSDIMQGVITPTAWHVVLIGHSPSDLYEKNYIIPLLCPPPHSSLPNMVDSRWVSVGKSLRVRKFEDEQTKSSIDWLALNNFQFIHFDAGWYGDENNATETATRVFPEFQESLHLDIIGEYATEKGVKVTLYVNELGLRETERLVQIYNDWKMSGIKFGFVNTLSQRAMRILHQRVLLSASKNLIVNIHDIFRPKGMTRTYPNLVTQEGIRGEERKPQADHHTILPFVRFLQGSADYTPRYIKGSGILCTQAHQLALPFIFYSPIQSLFWAEPANAVQQTVRWYAPELVVWLLMPTVWEDTRVLAGSIGEHAVIARRVGLDWFVGAITNLDPRHLSLNISTLFLDLPNHPRALLPAPPKGYLVHVFADAYSATAHAELPASQRNLIKVLPCVTFIMPASLSSSFQVTDPIPNYPEETSESILHAQAGQAHRQRIYDDHRQQMIADRKRVVQKESEYETLTNGVIELELAPSGGAVIYITPAV
jgi:hypothetical protein